MASRGTQVITESRSQGTTFLFSVFILPYSLVPGQGRSIVLGDSLPGPAFEAAVEKEKSMAFLSRGMGPEMAAPTMVIPMRCLFFLLLEAKPGTRRWSVDIARWPQQVLSLALERLSAGCP